MKSDKSVRTRHGSRVVGGRLRNTRDLPPPSPVNTRVAETHMIWEGQVNVSGFNSQVVRM